MSYEILYGRQFVSLGNGAYIPMILSGSSNCTMHRWGREMLERHWWPLGQGNCLGKTEEQLMQWMQKQVEKQRPDADWFKRSSKWLTAADMTQWMSSGIKSARTIEEIRRLLPSQFLHCTIIIYDETKSCGEEGYQRNESDCYIHTTEDLVKWVNEYKERWNKKGRHERVYPNMEFNGYESLGLGPKAEIRGPVLCKISNVYLQSFDTAESHSRYTLCPEISEAMVFESAEDFEEKTKELRLAKYRLISANQPEKNFVIKAIGTHAGNVYVKQKTCRQLKTTCYASDARKFVSEKAAQNYIDKSLEGLFPSIKAFEIQKIENKTK